jgi:hypothetical protein
MDMIHDHDFLSLLEKADVVITKPTSPEWDEQLAFGKGALRRVVESQTAEELNVVWLLVDWSSEEPEALAAVIARPTIAPLERVTTRPEESNSRSALTATAAPASAMQVPRTVTVVRAPLAAPTAAM